MYRILYIFVLLFVQSNLFGSELIRYPNDQGSLQVRHKWALQAASAEKSYWVGYSVTRLMYPNQIFMSGVSINGEFRLNKKKPSLQEWIYGIKIEPTQDIKQAARAELQRPEKNREKVWRDIGVFQRFQRGAKVPDRFQIMNLSVSSSFDAPLYWLGDATHEESFEHLISLYAQTPVQNKEDVMSAIGMHPARLAFPFLKKILTTSEPEEAQEAAAIFMGELDEPEALQLLQQVADKNPHESVREAAVVGISEMNSEASLQVLSDIARSHRDNELRETAIAMLADKEGANVTKILEEIAWFDSDEDIRETAVVMLGESEAGVPALLKIMEDHPSEDTREIAVHILAETVAGRKILKQKIKE